MGHGLALIARNETKFVNEPYVTGGNPILADNTLLFNDMLGSTVGRSENGSYAPVSMTAFGETSDRAAFFTGKPAVGDLGYAFLFRNYRSDLAKWQTQDPLGYPDGWNNFAYGNNQATMGIDSQGDRWHNGDFVAHYWFCGGAYVDTDTMGLTSDIYMVIVARVFQIFKDRWTDAIEKRVEAEPLGSGTVNYASSMIESVDLQDVVWAMRGGLLQVNFSMQFTWSSRLGNDGKTYRDYSWVAFFSMTYSDTFSDPFSFGHVGLPPVEVGAP